MHLFATTTDEQVLAVRKMAAVTEVEWPQRYGPGEGVTDCRWMIRPLRAPGPEILKRFGSA